MPVILGIDEVGRGPWAGPLVVGAVILGEGLSRASGAAGAGVEADNGSGDEPASSRSSDADWVAELTDSKKLTAKKRAELAPKILEGAAATGLGWVSSEEIDKYGLSASLRLATRRAVKQVLARKVKFDEIVIDGTGNFLVGTPLEGMVSTLKKADLLVREVSAASIIAKEARDEYMTRLAEQYPGYGFEKHVGYGTAAHSKALKELGVCPEHRRSFRPIKEILEVSRGDLGASRDDLKASRGDLEAMDFPQGCCKKYISKNKRFTDECCKNYNSFEPEGVAENRGFQAEKRVTEWLETQGHQIVGRNFRTKWCEIDVISVLEDKIYFTEVKYSARKEPLERITPKKLEQMRFAAEIFMTKEKSSAKYQPILAAAGVAGENFEKIEWFSL